MPRDRRPVRRELAVLGVFIGAALVLRAPALLYSVTNFDESLYLLIGDELTEGVLPFTGICDRKPFGLFALFALFATMPFDGVVASRLGASLAVGLSAHLLYRIAGHLFADEDRLIGWTAGLIYLVFTLATGGLASNSEIFHNALALLGLFLALEAIADTDRPRLGLFLAAGLALGLGIQIKQTVLFDMLAFGVGFFLLTTPRLTALGSHLRATAPALLALAAMSLLPSLAVILLYAASGNWEAWALANLGAQRGFIDNPGQPLEWDAAFRAMAEQAPLWLGALLAVILVRRLAQGPAERRAFAFLLVWIAAILLCQLFLRIAADHYFLQFLPALALLVGLLLARTLLVPLAGTRARAALLATLAGLAIFAVAKHPIIHSLYIVRDRVLHGDAWAGDNPRRIAADLKPVLRPGEAIYVVGFLPIIYQLTDAAIPTRYAFTGLPHRSYAGRDGCPWVEQKVELARILDSRPRFIIVEQGVFYAELDPEVRSLLDARLARDYRLRQRYEQHWVHHRYPFERFVMNGAAAADVYELALPAPPPVASGPAPTTPDRHSPPGDHLPHRLDATDATPYMHLTPRAHSSVGRAADS